MSSQCEKFLRVADQYKLGSLDTEKPHPLTANLSVEAKKDLPAAIATLKKVDTWALEKLGDYLPQVHRLSLAIHDTLKSKKKIYLCGCGATGRLSIAIEVFIRQGFIEEKYRDCFVGFMAGGDVALIKSIENFEDRPDYGARQLAELGFSEGDLLLGITEGGETPFVIGATEAALSISTREPWFLYCNPEKQLMDLVSRSKRILEHPRIRSISLAVGPMGLSGSTRMQASTILMAAIGWSIESGGNLETLQVLHRTFLETWKHLRLEGLEKIISAEADVYEHGCGTIYETREFGVSVLTDTTERSPTFSLPPFENEQDNSPTPGWCYLSVPDSLTSMEAWRSILGRTPRCLDWNDISAKTNTEYLYGFFIDGSCLKKRKARFPDKDQYRFKIMKSSLGFSLHFRDQEWSFESKHLSILDKNLFLKLILNIHSTLVMGRLGRFESNFMTYVRASNLKLIDRTIRYVQLLSKQMYSELPGYEETAKVLFRLAPDLSVEEPAVLRILEELRTQR